ncbi:SusC/RagA family TonB-linked outer membrane protein [Marinifilum sp.]|uniref:SusC/RagA family TonB-linked outer membrane protein n=1 Tax=Marinifilum sp. TaxID=2033137 RepID=UPI003BA872DB
MKITVLLLLIGILQVSASVYSQNGRISVEVNEMELSDLLWQLQEESGIVFVYKTKDLKGIDKVTVNKEDATLSEILDELLEDTSLEYRLKDDVVTIKRKAKEIDQQQQQQDVKTIKGKVTDKNGLALPGVSVRIKGTYTGTSTNNDGIYEIAVSEGAVLVFSFVGMESKEIMVGTQAVISVVMNESDTQLEDVIVTGLGFSWNKETFTGATTKVTADQIKEINPINIFQVLEVIDPSFQIMENEEFGSDPNRLPEIRLRGNSSLPNLSDVYEGDPNTPVFMVNGFQKSLQYVMDLAPSEIESITLLKDAAATAIYGSNSSNGIVVIELVRPKAGKLRVNYAVSAIVQQPDLSDYDMLNAEEKLEMELIRGYEGRHTDSYNSKQFQISDGIDTDWLRIPTRTGTNIRHSLGISGGANEFNYRISLNANPTKGVMKGSDRDRYSGGVTLNYRTDKIQVSNDFNYGEVLAEQSLHSSFSQYVSMNPYYSPVDNDGNIVYNMALEDDQNETVLNPLWNTTIGGYNRTKTTSFNENFRLRWQLIKSLALTGGVSYAKSINHAEVFLPSKHTGFNSILNPAERGSYSSNHNTTQSFNTRIGLSFFKAFGYHNINANANMQYDESESESDGFIATGFPSPKLEHPQFAVQYQTGTRPSGSSQLFRTLGLLGTFSYNYKFKYFADFSYRTDISSQFGANNRWAGFWSAGVGYNLDKEPFIKNLGFVERLSIRGSVGNTGSTSFNAYQALQVYSYNTNEYYIGNVVGTSLSGIGNPNLKWQRVLQKNISFNASLFNNLFDISASYYHNTTDDAIVDQSIHSYSGFSSYAINLGGIINKGVDFSFRSLLYNKNSVQVSVGLSGNRNWEKLKDLGDTYFNYNQSQLSNKRNLTPLRLIYEDESTTVRYIAHSLGIDPATGKELFLDENGNQTFEFTDAEIISFETAPDLRGSASLNFRYKTFRLGCSFQYGIGGKNFNSTVLGKVENIGLVSSNVDSRAFDERWRNPGDISFYKDVSDIAATYASSRFLQDASFLTLGSLSVSYDFNQESLKNLGFIRHLTISAVTNNLFRLSTIREERGTIYPFARTYNFSLRMNF